MDSSSTSSSGGTTSSSSVSLTAAPSYPHRRKDSNIVQVNATTRLGHLLGLQGLTTSGTGNGGGGSRDVDEAAFYHSVAAFLVQKHFNERRGDVLPHLPAVLDGCDFYWTYEFRDTQWSGLEAARQLMDATGTAAVSTAPRWSSSSSNGGGAGAGTSSASSSSSNNNATDHQQGYMNNSFHGGRRRKRRREQQQQQQQQFPERLLPFAFYGAFWSSVSKPLSVLGGGLELPQIAISTSAELDRMPYFARTVPTNDGDARAAVLYYQSLGVTHVAVLFVHDSWGRNYHASLQKYANTLVTAADHNNNHNNNSNSSTTTTNRVLLSSFPYDKNNIEKAVLDLKRSGYRHVFAILHDWKQVLRIAYRHGIIGQPGFVWLAAEEKKWTGEAFALDANTEADLAHALHGTGTLNLYFEPNGAFEASMRQMAHDPGLQREYLDTLADPSPLLLLQGTPNGTAFPAYNPPGFAYPIYDAVLALGITACNRSSGLPPLFTGKEFYDHLARYTEFKGLSGYIRFDDKTGTRQSTGVKYGIDNIVLSKPPIRSNSNNYFTFESHLTATIQGDDVQHIGNFHYVASQNGTTTVPPSSLPPIQGVNLHLIPVAAIAFGYVLATAVVLISTVCLVWTVLRRDSFVIRASQPIFLGQICLGTFLVGLAVFLLPAQSTMQTHNKMNNVTLSSLIERDDGDDGGEDGGGVACMGVMWLVTIGLITALSALTSKTWRLNRLVHSGGEMRRTTVHAVEAMTPCFVLLAFNIVMLLCITLWAPFRYRRTDLETSFDKFGRSLESFGSCQAQNDTVLYYLVPMVVVDFIAVIVTGYQAYRARNIRSEFSESYYLALSMASLTETVLLGGPILFVLAEKPTAKYVVCASLLSICCMAILVPIFLPKYIRRHRAGPTRNNTMFTNRVAVQEMSQRESFAAAANSSSYNINNGNDPTGGGVRSSITSQSFPSRSHGQMRFVRHGSTRSQNHNSNPDI